MTATVARPAAPAAGPRRRDVFPVLRLVVSLAAGLLPLAVHGRRQLWADETVSAYLARLPADELLRALWERELNGGAHSVLLAVLGLGDADEWLLRLPSALAVAAACWVLIGLAARRLGAAYGLLAGVLLGLLPGVVEVAANARSYALGVLVVAVLTSLVDRLTLRRCLLYGVVAGVGLYAHFFVALVVVGHVGFLVATGDPVLRRPRSLLLAAGPLAVLAAPLAAFLVSPGNRGQVSWVPALTGELFVDYTARSVVGMLGSPTRVLVLFAVLVLPAVLAGALGRRRGTGRAALLGAFTWLSVVLLAAAVSLAKPLFVPRYLWLALPGVVLLVVACVAAARPVLRAVVLVCWAGVVAVALPATTPSTEAWGDGVSAVRDLAAPGDAVDTYWRFLRPALTYYAPPDGTGGVDWTPAGPVSAEEFLTSADLRPRTSCLAPPTGGTLWLVVVTGRAEGPVESCTGRPVERAVEGDGYRVLAVR